MRSQGKARAEARARQLDPGTAANAPTALLRARAERYALTAAVAPSVACTVVSFLRGKSRYAISLDELREIRPLARWCPLPGAAPALPGVVYYRGELLSLCDLSALSTGSRDSTAVAWVLVVERHGERVGLMADDVMDVLALETGSIQALPLTMGDESDVFLGMSADRVLIVDMVRLFRSAALGLV